MSKHKNIPFLSPEKYIKTRARLLPLGVCYINEGWQQSGMAFIIVTRKHVNGNLTFAVFQVDLHCLGVKNAFFNFNVSSLEVDKIVETQNENSNGEDPLTTVDYVLVHNIIYGAVEYAEELGFKPHKDFDLVINILEEDDDSIDLMEIEFGLYGKPAIYIGKELHPKNIIAQLNRSVGQGNFRIIDQEDNQEEEFSDEHLFNLAEKKNVELVGSSDDFEDDSIEIIDKPIEELNTTDLEDIFHGRKQLSDMNIFQMGFTFMIKLIQKKEKKEVDRILEEIDSWNISDESPDEDDYIESGEEIQCFESLSELCETNPKRAIKPIQEAILKYPDNCLFYNLLGTAYEAMQELEVLNKLAEEIYCKFPNHVVTTCNYMNRLCLAGRQEEFTKLMDKDFDIHKQFPGRTCFTPNEMLAFLVPVINYHLEVNKVAQAAAYTFPLTLFEWDEYPEKIANLYYKVVGTRLTEFFPQEEISKL